MIVLDFETRSLCDLTKSGAAVYAADISTEVLCLCWAQLDTVQAGAWLPWQDPTQNPLWHLIRAGEKLVAHGTNFEKSIWREIMTPCYGWPEVPDGQWADTMASAAHYGLPLKLDRLTRELKLAVQKDMEGSRLTVGLSRPKNGMLPPLTPLISSRVAAYCHQDVAAQMAVAKRLGPLPPNEREVWLMSERINQRGFKIDLPLVHAMKAVVDEAIPPLAEEFRGITGGLKFTQIAKIGQWCKDNGYEISDLQSQTVAQALGSSPDLDPDDLDGGLRLPERVRRVLEIRQLIGSAAIKKLDSALACSDAEGIVRYSLQYHGASTGRWAGRLLQPHNFPRPTLKEDGVTPDPTPLVAALMTGDAGLVEALYGPPVNTVVSSLRHMIVPTDGHSLVVGDFGQIECRTLMAIAGQHDKLALLAESGSKTYLDMGASIYGRPITKDDVVEYAIAKNTVLGCGFGMAKDKFHDKYAPHQPMSFCEGVIDTYRQSWAPKVPKFWYALEETAAQAVWDKKAYETYGIVFKLEREWLTLRLPSGRKLWYFNPRPTRDLWNGRVRQGWFCVAQKLGRSMVIHPYGGMLAENVASGMARDLLVEAMFKCEAEGLPIILTVHDELITNPLTKHADPEKLRQIMEDTPAWAKGLQIPVMAECWSGDRYRK